MLKGLTTGLVSTLVFLLSAAAGAQEIVIDAPYVDPYEGMWVPVGEPGSGLVIDQQGDTLVVTVFTYREDGSPAWYLAFGKIEQGVFETTASEYAGGSCPNCAFQPAEQREGGKPIRLEIVNRTNAWLTWNGGERIPLRFLAFAVDDQQIWPDESPFGTPSAPQLIGRWLFVGQQNGSEPFVQEALFDSFGFLDPGGVFWGADGEPFNGGVECLGGEFGAAVGETVCRLLEFGSESQSVLASAHWGDIGPVGAAFYSGDPVPAENGIRGSELIHGFRLTGPLTSGQRNETGETRENLDPARYLEKGMWTIPGKPGSGIMLDWQDEVLVYVIFTYDEEGNPIWLQGSGLLGADSTIGSAARRFTGGTCLNCDYADSHEAGEPVGVRLEFHSKTTGTFTFDGGEAMPIRSLAFDSPRYREFGQPTEFGSPALYDLRGEWVFISTEGMDRFFRRVTFSEPNGGENRLAWQNADGSMAFRCDVGGRFSSPQCRLLDFSGESAERLFSAHWADVGEDQIIGYEAPPLSGEGGRTRGERLIFGFRLSEPNRAL